MTRLVAKVVMWLALAAVIAVAGIHFVYYLYQWEWGRAGIAGSGFTAALVLGATFLFLNRLQRIERRLDQILLAQQSTATTAAAAPPEVEPRPDFPWLAPTGPQVLGVLALAVYEPPRPSVFIPVFLAAGLAISASAGVVERIAAARYRGTAARGTAATPPTARQVLATRPRRSLVLLPVIGAVLTALAVVGLYAVAHYWSKPIGPGVTTMTVEVDSRGPVYPDIEVVESVGRYCSMNSGIGVRYLGVARGSGETTLLRLAPLLDEDAQDRFIGCVEDAVLEWHSLDVTRTELAPE